MDPVRARTGDDDDAPGELGELLGGHSDMAHGLTVGGRIRRRVGEARYGHGLLWHRRMAEEAALRWASRWDTAV